MLLLRQKFKTELKSIAFAITAILFASIANKPDDDFTILAQ